MVPGAIARKEARGWRAEVEQAIAWGNGQDWIGIASDSSSSTASSLAPGPAASSDSALVSSAASAASPFNSSSGRLSSSDGSAPTSIPELGNTAGLVAGDTASDWTELGPQDVGPHVDTPIPGSTTVCRTNQPRMIPPPSNTSAWTLPARRSRFLKRENTTFPFICLQSPLMPAGTQQPLLFTQPPKRSSIQAMISAK